MEDVSDHYHVFTNSLAKNVSLTIEETLDMRYVITVDLFVGVLPEESNIKLNFFVIDGTRNGPQDSSLYLITSEGLKPIL